MPKSADKAEQTKQLTDAERLEYSQMVKDLIKEMAHFTDVLRNDVDALGDLFRELSKP